MAKHPPNSVIPRLRAWRTANALSQTQAVKAFAKGGLPIKLGTLQQWERGRSSPQSVTAAALDMFLSAQNRKSVASTAPAPVIRRLKAWREANNFSQIQAVDFLCRAGLPAKFRTLQDWESGRRHPRAITAAALQRFLDEHEHVRVKASAH
jgi:transcriptional regulator with XRE-family HTH domain